MRSRPCSSERWSSPIDQQGHQAHGGCIAVESGTGVNRTFQPPVTGSARLTQGTIGDQDQSGPALDQLLEQPIEPPGTTTKADQDHQILWAQIDQLFADRLARLGQQLDPRPHLRQLLAQMKRHRIAVTETDHPNARGIGKGRHQGIHRLLLEGLKQLPKIVFLLLQVAAKSQGAVPIHGYGDALVAQLPCQGSPLSEGGKAESFEQSAHRGLGNTAHARQLGGVEQGQILRVIKNEVGQQPLPRRQLVVLLLQFLLNGDSGHVKAAPVGDWRPYTNLPSGRD